MKLVTFTDNGTATRQLLSEPCTVFVDGTFGSGTLSLQVSRTSTSDLIEIASFTTDGVVNVNFVGPYYITGVLTGATSPSLNVGSGRIP
jgi:hypothetical protein